MSENQVIDQYRVIVFQAERIAELARLQISLLEGGYYSDSEGVLQIVGNRSAAWMEALGDMINSVDASTDEDEWTAPIFEKAHLAYPQKSDFR